MTTRRRLLALMVLLLVACRLPYEIGRRLSPDAQVSLDGTQPAVAIDPEAGTAEPSGLPSLYPGGLQATIVPGDYPGQGGFAPTAGPAEYPGFSPATDSSEYPEMAGPSGSPTAGVSSQGYPPVASTETGDEQTIAHTALPPTQIASPTPYLTPTPTLTHTPTVTPTPLPPPAWSRAALEATDPLTVKLASGKVQLVEFFAFWSGPSQAMAPLVRGVEREYGARVNFIYLDIDDPAVETFAEELEFDSPPHFFLLAPNGAIIDEWVGYVSLAELRGAIESALNP